MIKLFEAKVKGLLVKVPDDTYDMTYCKVTNHLSATQPTNMSGREKDWFSDKLPKGNWVLLIETKN